MSSDNKRICAWAAIAAAGVATGLTPQSRAQDQLWLHQFGTSGHEGASALAPDGSGGLFVAGGTDGDLGGTGAGLQDAWFARYDAGGNRLWIRQLGSGDIDYARALARDGIGGTFVAGATFGALGGPNAGNYDVWLARYDAAGNQVWIRQFGAASHDFADALAFDGSGGVFIAGSTHSSLGGPNAGYYDAWLAHHDADGNQTWITQFGASGVVGDGVSSLAVDSMGGVYAGGYTGGALGGASAGRNDAWIARFDATGNQAWMRQFGTTEDDTLWAIAQDDAGGVFLAGSTSGDMGGPNAGKNDPWIARFDSAGVQLWLHQIGTPEWDNAFALAPDGAGGVHVAGNTWGNLAAPHAGGWDAWIAHYDSAGSQTWIEQFGTTQNDSASALASDSVGGAFAGGRTEGGLGGPSAGNGDVWIAHFGSLCYPDCDQSTGFGVLDIFDFLCFQNSFVSAEPYACDCDTSTGPLVCDIFDFLCFQNAFVGGCQ